VFSVKDNGIGMDKSLHNKVFDLFYRVDRSGEGTGAGLAIVERIIEVITAGYGSNQRKARAARFVLRCRLCEVKTTFLK
jgi:signal transduction histidine kinase